MKIYLVQHGKAYSEFEDPKRPLNETGNSQVLFSACWLKAKKMHVSKIIHSPKLRAKETAEIFARVLNSQIPLEETNGILPNDDVSAFSTKLTDKIMVVGHLPFLNKLTSYLLTGDPNKTITGFQNGGIVCLQKKQKKWAIAWITSS